MDECKCNGRGIIEKEGKLYECICAILMRRAASMPPYVRIADLRPEHLTHNLHAHVHKSLFVMATWPDMKAIIKAVMIRHINLFVRVTSDNEILHAYVGNMARKNKNDNEASFENVGDFIGPPNLAIVRLNAITRPNKAAAGALEEALVCRSDHDKPIWLVSDMDRHFTSTSPAYSESLWDLIEAMPKVRIPPILPRNAPAGVLDVELVGSGSPAPAPAPAPASKSGDSPPKKTRPKPEPERRAPPRDAEDDDFGLSVYGSGLGKKKPFGRGDD
jgi:hypothetical protein